jgi:hypothetical protein
MIRGSVDTITSKFASGWIYSDAQKESLSVQAMINDEVVGKALANLQRPDLEAAGFGDGRCGFEIQFTNEINSLYLPFIQVMLAGTDLELRRWAGAGFGDYFRALYQRYPNTGRSASVLGGLWIDRTDASALLKGRTDIGVLAPREANCVARLIQDGVFVMARDRKENATSSGQRASSDLVAAVADAMFDEDVLKILRAILDDHPVAVRADAVKSGEKDFIQMSAIEELPSPAECLGLICPEDEQAISVDVVRGGHRFPEFLSDGLSRWAHAAAERNVTASLSPDLPVDRHLVPRGSSMFISPGTLYRIGAAAGGALRILVLPSRLSLLRFHKKAPRGELTHKSGARIWI